MLSENEIPDFVGSTTQDVRRWWDQMISLGLNTHPDDDPADIVMIENDEPALDSSTCKKVQGIYQKMFDIVGDSVYEIGTAAYMSNLGYLENLKASPENGLDYWVRSTK